MVVLPKRIPRYLSDAFWTIHTLEQHFGKRSESWCWRYASLLHLNVRSGQISGVLKFPGTPLQWLLPGFAKVIQAPRSCSGLTVCQLHRAHQSPPRNRAHGPAAKTLRTSRSFPCVLRQQWVVSQNSHLHASLAFPRRIDYRSIPPSLFVIL